MYSFLVDFVFIVFICLKCTTCTVERQTCPTRTNCLNTNFCQKQYLFYSEEFESGKELSDSTCFHASDLNFTMGTNEPIFISDGESPARKIHLSPFCIDQTEVSNAQFYQFVLKTNYTTEVLNNLTAKPIDFILFKFALIRLKSTETLFVYTSI
jgi:hypothetical protein